MSSIAQGKGHSLHHIHEAHLVAIVEAHPPWV